MKNLVTLVCVLCGNGSIEGTETCDDGNAVADDGCTNCAIDVNYDCVGSPSVCQPECGNGKRIVCMKKRLFYYLFIFFFFYFFLISNFFIFLLFFYYRNVSFFIFNLNFIGF